METFEQSNPTNTSDIIAVSKKHWCTLIIPVILCFICLNLFLTKHPILAAICLAIAIPRTIAILRTSWTLTPQFLIIQGGFLPWKRIYLQIPKENIYESFYSKSLLGTIFGFSNITIRKTDGNTSGLEGYFMNNAKQFTSEINSMVYDLKKKEAPIATFVHSNHSVADEIQKLAQLRNQGVITEEEFQVQKAKLMQ